MTFDKVKYRKRREKGLRGQDDGPPKPKRVDFQKRNKPWPKGMRPKDYRRMEDDE